MIIQGDCLDILTQWVNEEREPFIDLIYIDPPYGRNSVDSQFGINWNEYPIDETLFSKFYNPSNEGKAYITYMFKRVKLMREMLKDTGSFYYHCDPTMSHYIKIMLDYVFGILNYRNEIIWKRDSVGRGAKKTSTQWSREIDIILFYTKTKSSKFSQLYTDELQYTQLKEFAYSEPDGRKYKIVRLGDYSQISIENMRKQNLIHTTSKGNEYKKYYLDEFKLAIGSMWYDIPNISHGRNKEKIGYDTQKPEKLLERIILASSNENDLVADFFIGGGTTIATAIKNNRKFIGVDINSRAIQITKERIEKLGLPSQ